LTAGLFNACDYLLDRHVREGRGGRLALTGTTGYWSRYDASRQVFPGEWLQDDKVAL
jgi:hypothetical protein